VIKSSELLSDAAGTESPSTKIQFELSSVFSFDNGQETRIGGNEDSAIPGHSMGNRFV
jgi:hypothetical protein